MTFHEYQKQKEKKEKKRKKEKRCKDSYTQYGFISVIIKGEERPQCAIFK